MTLLLQCAALIFALFVLSKGMSLARSPGRRRIAVVFMLMGTLFSVVCGSFVYLQWRGSPLAAAPGYGLHFTSSAPLLHEATPGIFGAASYERDLYGTGDPASGVARALFTQLAPRGYTQTPPTAGPGFRAGEPLPTAQFGLAQWRFRVYELALPTRYAGRDFDGREFAHLVAVVLSNDGK